jgi:branched-chain amino acid transport system permease protein
MMTLTKRYADIIAVAVLMIFSIIIVPLILPFDITLQIALYCSFAVLALSLAFVWGYAGIFSFGQGAFFGIAGYSYAVLVINIGESTLPVIAALLVPFGFALLLGYFLFYGRLSSIYVAIITLVVNLIIHKFMGQTAGSMYDIGNAHLGGYNGIGAIPPLNFPGCPSKVILPEHIFYVSGIALLLSYVGVCLLTRSRFGRLVAGLRENEVRLELLGYDVRFLKMIVFAIGAVIAAIAGVTFVNWNAFIDPHVFDLPMSAEIVIWVVVGGVGSFLGPVLAAVFLGFLTIELGTQQTLDVNILLGGILTLFVFVLPRGIAPSIGRALAKMRNYRLQKNISRKRNAWAQKSSV